jgi:hypothetical protein
MATELTASTPHDRANRVSTIRSWAANTFPWRAVVLPWIVARVVVVGTMMLPAEPRQIHLQRLILLDGQWFRIIAMKWYDGPYVHGHPSTFPFFPLYPALVGGAWRLGAPLWPTMVGLSWLFALIAMAGAYRLARRHLPATAAPWATWFLVLAPGAITMVMAYSDALYLAGLVWALVLAEDRRWWAAGFVAAIATAARPNGWIAVVALVVTVAVSRAGWRALVAVVAPSTMFLACWCWYLWSVTGDPLVFYDAKSAWQEIRLGDLLDDPFSGRHSAALFHFLFAVAGLVFWALRARRQPPAWAAIVVLGVVPSLQLGLEGVARYAILAFPVPFAVADVLTARGRVAAGAGLVVSGAGLVALAYLVVAKTWLP